MRHQAVWVIGAVVAALACGELGPEDYLPPGSPPPIATDATVYTLEPSAQRPGAYVASAHATYTNRSGRNVYIAGCGGLNDPPVPSTRIRRTGPDSAAPTMVGTPYAIEACGQVARLAVVPPGGTVVADVWLGSTDVDDQPPITDLTPEQRIGQYRIEFMLCTGQISSSEDCDPLPQAAQESNAFEVRFPEP
jgi:hypothetical protein